LEDVQNGRKWEPGKAFDVVLMLGCSRVYGEVKGGGKAGGKVLSKYSGPVNVGPGEGTSSPENAAISVVFWA
jgi:hypothetical protein